MNVVSLQGVGKQFGHQVVFDGLNQTFFAGEKVGLIGPNGSGKTTLLRLILGEIEPDVGKVVRSKSLRIGYLPQEAAFDGSRTVMEEMHAGLDDVLGNRTVFTHWPNTWKHFMEPSLPRLWPSMTD